MAIIGVKDFRINTNVSYNMVKIAGNNVEVKQGTLICLKPNGFSEVAGPSDIIEGVTTQTKHYEPDNETMDKSRVEYQPALRENTYKMKTNGLTSQAMVGKFFRITPEQTLDTATVDTTTGQVRVESIISDSIVEIRIVPVVGTPISTPTMRILGSVATKADLDALPTAGLVPNDAYIVIADETQGGVSTIYFRNGTNRVFGGVTSGYFADKLDKNRTVYTLYWVSPDGNQFMYPISRQSWVPLAIAQRNSAGNLESWVPTLDGEVVIKAYLEQQLQDIQAEIDIKADKVPVIQGISVAGWSMVMDNKTLTFLDTEIPLDQSSDDEDIVFTDNGYIIEKRLNGAVNTLGLWKGSSLVAAFWTETGGWNMASYDLPADVGSVLSYDSHTTTSTQWHFNSIITDGVASLLNLPEIYAQIKAGWDRMMRIEKYDLYTNLPTKGDEHVLYRVTDSNDMYLRSGSDYVLFQGGVAEAPNDDFIYWRFQEQWVMIDTTILVDAGIEGYNTQTLVIDGGQTSIDTKTEVIDGGDLALYA